tara:strand:+ start:306 stop:527 length:222 start_codon:yes stop_codon:yes gene_type:complete
MSNIHLTVGKSVRNLVDFIKTNVQNNMYKTINESNINLTEEETKQLIRVAISSVDQGYQNGYIEVETALKNSE